MTRNIETLAIGLSVSLAVLFASDIPVRHLCEALAAVAAVLPALHNIPTGACPEEAVTCRPNLTARAQAPCIRKHSGLASIPSGAQPVPFPIARRRQMPSTQL
jgi:hypothetical protein